MKYKISIPAKEQEELNGSVFGYEGVHDVCLSDNGRGIEAIFDGSSKTSLIERIHSFVKAYQDAVAHNRNTQEHNEEIDRGKKKGSKIPLINPVTEFVNLRQGYHAAVAAYIMHGVCMNASMVAAYMKEFAQDVDFTFTYTLRDPSPNTKLWNLNYMLTVGDGLKGDFNLDIEGFGVYPISVEEVSDIEKIAESTVKQGQETTAGAD